MTTVTVTDGKTPSQQIVDDATRIVEIKDTKGRTFGIRRLDMSSEIRIAKAVTPENAAKDRYVALVNLAACVVSIDGEMVTPCRNELQFDALLERLGSEGFSAVAQGMRENFMPAGVADAEK